MEISLKYPPAIKNKIQIELVWTVKTAAILFQFLESIIMNNIHFPVWKQSARQVPRLHFH